MQSKLKVPWGYDAVMVSTDLYSMRMMLVSEGERTNYVYKKKQDSTIYVLQGIVHMTVEGKVILLNEGDRYHIHPRIMHRFNAIKGDATILEVGTRIEEDDVIVVEDDYGDIR